MQTQVYVLEVRMGEPTVCPAPGVELVAEVYPDTDAERKRRCERGRAVRRVGTLDDESGGREEERRPASGAHTARRSMLIGENPHRERLGEISERMGVEVEAGLAPTAAWSAQVDARSFAAASLSVRLPEPRAPAAKIKTAPVRVERCGLNVGVRCARSAWVRRDLVPNDAKEAADCEERDFRGRP